jgi:hypothetical protein
MIHSIDMKDLARAGPISVTGQRISQHKQVGLKLPCFWRSALFMAPIPHPNVSRSLDTRSAAARESRTAFTLKGSHRG